MELNRLRTTLQAFRLRTSSQAFRLRTSGLAFRLFGYGGLGLVAVAGLQAGPTPGYGLLLVYAVIAPVLWWVFIASHPEFLRPYGTRAVWAHTLEGMVAMVVTILCAGEFRITLVVGLVVLAGVAAQGGLRFLVPSLVTVVGVVIIVPGPEAEVSPATLASVVLAFGFMLGIALTSFRRVRRLHTQHHQARSESMALKNLNARLTRYLPGDLGSRLGDEGQQPAAPAYRFATVAFIDVVGFTELVVSRPLAELVDVVNDFLTRVVELTEARGGVVGKFLGDGVLVYFPEPHRDSSCRYAGSSAATARITRAESAGRCAALCLEVAETLQVLERTWRARGVLVKLNVRVGIASGYCAIGDWGGGGRLDYTVIGEPVNLACRLQTLAEPGGVLLSEVSGALMTADPDFAERLSAGEPRQIKGFGVRMVHELTASAKVRAIAGGARNSRETRDRQDIPQSLPGRVD